MLAQKLSFGETVTDKTLYTNALEVLIENCIRNQVLDNCLPHIKQIASLCDTMFQTNENTKGLGNKIEFYNKTLINEDELFVNSIYTPYLLRNNLQSKSREAFKIYITILCWLKHYDFPNSEIIKDIYQPLKIEKEIASETYRFFLHNQEIINSDRLIVFNPSNDNYMEKLEGSWVENNSPTSSAYPVPGQLAQLRCTMQALFIDEWKMFIVSIDSKLGSTKRNNDETNCCSFFLEHGDFVLIDNIRINFYDLKQLLLRKRFGDKYIFTSTDIVIQSDNERNAPLSFSALPGNFIGMISPPGIDKSILLKTLSGYRLPISGNIQFNTYSIFSNKYQLAGHIGYVSGDDLLIPELTLFENLQSIANLYLTTLNLKEKKHKIVELLQQLELSRIKDLTIGKPEEKRVTSTERRLANIALELIRDPHILFVDDSTQSLSTSEASEIIRLLSKQTFKGKLIITSITEVSDEAFQCFDKLLLLTQEGANAYYGLQCDTIKYLSSNFNNETVSRINSETKNKSEFITRLNSINTVSVYDTEQNIGSAPDNLDNLINTKKNRLPGSKNLTPRLDEQFIAFLLRDIKIKFSNKKSIFISFLSYPVIAATICLIIKFLSEKGISFYDNTFIPFYFYISIIVNIFLGLTLSGNEFIRLRRIFQKEAHLNLSLFSLANAKIAVLLSFSLLNTLLYSIAGNSILSIKGMLFEHWLIYLSCSAFGIFLGLLFSSIHHRSKVLYLLTIPLTMLIIIYLGGDFNYLGANRNQRIIKPFFPKNIVNRLAYEAIIVNQHYSNPYSKLFKGAETKISLGYRHTSSSLPEIRRLLNTVENHYTGSPDSIKDELIQISAYLLDHEIQNKLFPFEYIKNLQKGTINELILLELNEYIEYLQYTFSNEYYRGIRKKQFIIDSITNKYGEDYLTELKQGYTNYRINSIIENSLANNSTNKFTSSHYSNNKIKEISLHKKINNQLYTTYEYNISIIWLINLILYSLLITNVVKAFINKIEQFLRTV